MKRRLFYAVSMTSLLVPFMLPGCLATLVMDDPTWDRSAADDDVGDEEDAGDDDSSEGPGLLDVEPEPWDGASCDDDEPTGDDDDTGDDDTTADDMSYVHGERLLHVDFPPEIETGWGYQDCMASYGFEGSDVTASVGDLCPSCDHLYLVEFTLSAEPQALDCVAQLGWDGAPFLRIFGIELLAGDEFAVWRNFDDPGNVLIEHGSGEFQDSAFTCESDATTDWWYAYWSEGQGTFGS